MSSGRRSLAMLVCVALGCFGAPGAARADWREWLRSKMRSVERGNEKFGAGDAKGALAEYDKAAREAPSEGGVHLNRGLALMQAGETAPAREALRLATQPPGSREVRADAHYDLGLGFYREADALAGEERHDEAQQLFREAKDAFRESLRLHPGNRDAAWNLELAARRLREQEEKQKTKEEQEKKDQEKKDQEQEEKDPNQDAEKQNQDGSGDQDAHDGEPNEDPSKDGSESQKPEDGPKKEPPAPEPPKPAPAEDAQKPPAPQPAADPAKEDAEAKPLPADMGRALDSLQDSEQNLERLKAHMRARRDRRVPEKDW